MAATEGVGTFPCLGGCGRSLDPEAYPSGVCPDCEPAPYQPGFKRRSD